MSNMETTYVMVKSDGVARALTGKIISKFEKRGLQLVGLKMQVASESLAKEHYIEHAARPFYGDLTKFLSSGPVVSAAFKGPNSIAVARQILGKTNHLQAELDSIRGTYALSTSNNCCHASDSPEAAKRELDLWFKQGDIIDYENAIKQWVWQ
eukprot:UN00814